jgi:hypothetical protein
MILFLTETATDGVWTMLCAQSRHYISTSRVCPVSLCLHQINASRRRFSISNDNKLVRVDLESGTAALGPKPFLVCLTPPRMPWTRHIHPQIEHRSTNSLALETRASRRRCGRSLAAEVSCAAGCCNDGSLRRWS